MPKTYYAIQVGKEWYNEIDGTSEDINEANVFDNIDDARDVGHDHRPAEIVQVTRETTVIREVESV